MSLANWLSLVQEVVESTFGTQCFCCRISNTNLSIHYLELLHCEVSVKSSQKESLERGNQTKPPGKTIKEWHRGEQPAEPVLRVSLLHSWVQLGIFYDIFYELAIDLAWINHLLCWAAYPSYTPQHSSTIPM